MLVVELTKLLYSTIQYLELFQIALYLMVDHNFHCHSKFSLIYHLGIRGHLSSITQSIVPNALSIIFGVFNKNVFDSLVGSWYSWSTFGEPICVNYWVPSLVDLFTSSISIWVTIITSSSIGWSTWYAIGELNITPKPLYLFCVINCQAAITASLTSFRFSFL